MEQRDYILRQIDQLAKALATVLFQLSVYIKQEQIRDGIEKTDQALKDQVGHGIADLVAMPAEDFFHFIQNEGAFSRESMEKLADLMLLIADELNAENPHNEQTRPLYDKCLIIYKNLNREGELYSMNVHFKIERIETGTDPFHSD